MLKILFFFSVTLLLHANSVAEDINECAVESSNQKQIEDLYPAFRGIANAASRKELPDFIEKTTVKLEIKCSRDTQSTTCTGVIIDKERILTADHCIRCPKGQANATSIQVMFGKDTNKQVVESGVGKVITHPRGEDMAMFKVTSIPKGFRPIKVKPKSIKLEKGDPLIIAGYGMLSRDKRGDMELNWGKTQYDSRQGILEYTKQGLTYSNIHIIKNPKRMMSNICSGDSGGPTFYSHKGEHYLVGISSGAAPKCEVTSTAFIAYPTDSIDWINKQI